MPVTVRDMGEPPKGPPDLSLLFAGLFILFFLFLGGRAIILGLMPSPSPAATLAVAATAAPQATIAPVVATVSSVAPAPEPAPSATAAASLPAPTAPGCPDAITLPSGARVGWVARAAGCPAVVLANLGGAHGWVLRGDLSDEIFEQLPEVQP